MSSVCKFTPERVLAIRVEHDLSQEEMGRWLGVSGSTVSRWESGESHPHGRHLAKFNQVFGGEDENNHHGQGRRDQDALADDQ